MMLGVCYYPEHWPRTLWAEDARRMRALGLSHVRIGEFAWSRLEPSPGAWHFEWMDEAIAVLGEAGLRVVLGTPTATPPKWLIDQHPDILPVDPHSGRTRGFGSRRHYDFSSETYLREALRITEVLARRYGTNPMVAGWQTDNELCCHDTALSASPAATRGFRRWCAERYGTIEALNHAWGNVFWSMEYATFEDIELPLFAVCETNPAHRLAYRRYSSDRVAHFHAAQVAVIRRHARDQWVTHNFIPMDGTAVDNYAICEPLDFVSFDSYPLGITDMAMAAEPAERLRPYMRTGHPDLTALYLDQTRGLSKQPFWLMEQQPGQVNWAPHNPRPAPGMIRLWSLQAFAHGAACVSYFRWRQVPFAQEQMHAGLRRPDDMPGECWPEVAQVAEDIRKLGALDAPAPRAAVAIIIDIESRYVSDIERQAAGYHYHHVLFQWYRVLRGLGLDIDFVAPGASLDGYGLVLAPALAMPGPTAVAALQASSALLVFGPRSGSKTCDFTIPDGLPPGPLRALVPIRVRAVETLRPDCAEPLAAGASTFVSRLWRETLDVLSGDVIATYENGEAAAVRAGRSVYLASLTDDDYLQQLFLGLCRDAGLATTQLPDSMRLRRRGALTFAFNYSKHAATAPAPAAATFVLGSAEIPPFGVVVWRSV
jgi:beta-galactosidase